MVFKSLKHLLPELGLVFETHAADAGYIYTQMEQQQASLGIICGFRCLQEFQPEARPVAAEDAPHYSHQTNHMKLFSPNMFRGTTPSSAAAALHQRGVPTVDNRGKASDSSGILIRADEAVSASSKYNLLGALLSLRVSGIRLYENPLHS